MGLPFEPESITAQQERYADAVEETIDRYRNQTYRIGQQRKHVFDCPDGIRLIISREVNDLGTFIHFSGSLEPGYLLYEQVEMRRISGENCCRQMIARFRDISRDYRKAKFEGFSPEAKVPHWSIKLATSEAERNKRMAEEGITEEDMAESLEDPS